MISQKLSSRHYQELIESGLNEQSILATQIFTISDKKEAKKLTGYALEGMIIPYIDPMGKAYTTDAGTPFCRIKPDWAPMEDLDEKPKYLSPKGEGNRPYFAPTFKQWEKVLRTTKTPIHITEGEKKAALLGSLGYAAIGLTGVHGWKDKNIRVDEIEEIPAQLLEDYEDRDKALNQLEDSRPLPELDLIGDVNIWKHRKVYISFDSDVIHKWQVKNALLQLAEWLKSKGAEPLLVLLPTEIDGSKNGVDDFIVRHGKEAYQTLLKVAEPALVPGKDKQKLKLPADPALPIKSILAWSVLKEHWRYRPGIGWHHWTGTHWQLKDDGTGTFLDRSIIEFLRANKWQRQEGGALSDLKRILKSDLIVEDWNPNNKIAFQNGVLDFDNEQFTPKLSREDFITVLLPYPYDPLADCPTWKGFLNTALKGEQKAIELIQAFFKWSLMPKFEGNCPLQVCWDLYGSPGTGKSTILEVLTGIVGSHNCGTFSTQTFKDGNALAALLDKRVSICADDSGHMENVGLFNRVISNETVEVKYLYKNIISTRLNTFLVRSYNDFPTTPSNSQGLNRRIVAMTFSHRPDCPDIRLGEKLRRELAGVFNWAWQISRSDLTERITRAGEVASVIDASTERFLSNNPVFAFLQYQHPNGGKEPAKNFYFQYQEWCKENGRTPCQFRLFIASAKSFGCYQAGVIKGYVPYIIPPMKDFDIIQFLGIAKGTQSEASSNKLPILEKSGDPPSEAHHCSQPKNSNSPLSCQPESLPENTLDKNGGNGEKLPLRSSQVNTSAEVSTTLENEEVKCNIKNDGHSDGKDTDIEVTKTPEAVEHEIGFKTMKLRNAWDKFIALKFAVYGILNKHRREMEHFPRKDGETYSIYFRHATPELIKFLQTADLTKMP